MLSDGTRRALAAMLYDIGFTGVARLVAENTSDVFEMTGDEDDWTDTVLMAVREAERTRRAQLVLVTPDGEGEWLKPELVSTIETALSPRRLAELREDAAAVAAEERREPTPEEWKAAHDGTGPAIRFSTDAEGDRWQRVPLVVPGGGPRNERKATPDPFAVRDLGDYPPVGP